MKPFHLLLCAALACLNVACGSRHIKRHRVQNSEDVDAPVVVSATLNADDSAADGAAPGELPYCFSWEPCQFVFTKKNPKDNMPVRKTIPSWCRCDATQKCALAEYDRRKKMDVHKCVDAEQPMSISVRHLRSRGGSEQWVFDMPMHRSSSRRSNNGDNDSIES